MPAWWQNLFGQATAPGPNAERVAAHLTEYSSLRQESLAAIGNRIQILSFSFGALAVVLAAVVAVDVDILLRVLVAGIFVPLAAGASLLIWMGEYHRSQRAGRGLAEIERRINLVIESGDPRPDLFKPMGWESKLIGRQEHMTYPYFSAIIFLVLMELAGFGIGYFFLVTGWPYGYNYVWPALVIAAANFFFVRFLVHKWKNARVGYKPSTFLDNGWILQEVRVTSDGTDVHVSGKLYNDSWQPRTGDLLFILIDPAGGQLRFTSPVSVLNGKGSTSLSLSLPGAQDAKDLDARWFKVENSRDA